MTLAFVVYLIYFISGLKLILFLTTLCSFCTLFISTVIKLGRENFSWNYERNGQLKEEVKQFRAMIDKLLKYSFISLIISSLLVAIIPSEKTAWLMVGAYTGQKIAENEKVQELSGKVIQIIEKRIDQYLVEEAKK